MSNLVKRFCSAAVLILFLLVLSSSETAISFKSSTLGLISIIILGEYSRLFKSRFCQVFFPILFVGILLIISMPFATGYLEIISSYYFGFLCLLWLLVSFKVLTYRNENINDFLISIFGYFFLLSFFASLFYMTINPGIFIFTIIVVSIADSSAFFVGRMMGKTPLLPNVSPGKTIEGFIGGILIASLFSSLIALFYNLQDRILEFLILGFLIGLVSVIGDIFFSLLKRNKGIKDSSKLIPGHGGFIDLLDGTIAALPLLTFLSFRINELGSTLALIGF